MQLESGSLQVHGEEDHGRAAHEANMTNVRHLQLKFNMNALRCALASHLQLSMSKEGGFPLCPAGPPPIADDHIKTLANAEKMLYPRATW